MDKDAVKEVFLEKSAGMKRAELSAYIVSLKISIITDIPQKVRENINALNVGNILTTLPEPSLKTVVSLLRRCSTLSRRWKQSLLSKYQRN
jgi:hypothetical protein